MRLFKPQYKIDPESVSWVFELKNPKQAYAVWHKRWVKLFERSIELAPVSQCGYSFCSRLETEMYERLCALKYPNLIELTEEQKFFLDSPRGSFIIQLNKDVYFRGEKSRIVRVIIDTDKNFVGR